MTGMALQEICEQAFHNYMEPLVSYGAPFVAICSAHVTTRFHASKIYIIASKSLTENTSALTEFERALWDKIVGIRIGFPQHTPTNECLNVISDIQDVRADLIISIGGGSISDAAKIIAYVRTPFPIPIKKERSIVSLYSPAHGFQAPANGVTDKTQLLALPYAMGPRLGPGGDTRSSEIPITAITTSLSGAEYVPFAGVTDEDNGVRHQFTGNCKGPNLIIISDELPITVPVRVWLAAGVELLTTVLRHCTHCCGQRKAGKRQRGRQ